MKQPSNLSYVLYIAAITLPLICCYSSSRADTDASIQHGLEKWEDVQWVENPSNDGDSFHVRYRGKEELLRLYYVDTPETVAASETDARRVRDQTRYFGLQHHRDTVHFGFLAARFVREQLQNRPFTVYTARATAPGRSITPRMYAMVETSDGKDLAALLAANGLARVYGLRRTLPDGTPADEAGTHMEDLERAAMLDRRGIWARSSADELVSARATARRESADLQAISAAASHPAAKIDVNTASLQELQILPGIGPVTARNLIAKRPFAKPDDLLRVPRITSQVLENLLPHLIWSGNKQDDTDD